jgi:hypothetical protein
MSSSDPNDKNTDAGDSTSADPVKIPSATTRLNSRQGVFCRLYALGKSATEAYAQAYGCADRNAAKSAASRLLTNVNVQNQIDSLRRLEDTAARLTMAERRRFLRLVVLTPIDEVDQYSNLCQSLVCRRNSKGGVEIITVRMPDKLRAIELDCILAGELRHGELKADPVHDPMSRLLTLIRAGR